MSPEPPRRSPRLEFDGVSLRRARRADVPELVRVSMSAFRGTTGEDLWTTYYARNRHLPLERVLVAERQGRLLGSAALLDLRMAVDGKPRPVDGVAAVAVGPSQRRQGVAEALLSEAVVDAWRRRVPFSLLYAFRGSFYRRFGYAPVEMDHLVTTAPRLLPDFPERRHVRPLEPDDRPAVERCYRRWSAGRTGPLVRSAQWWERRVLRSPQDRVVYIAPRTRRLEGYALATLVGNAALGDRRLRVQELVAVSVAARRGLLGWLASLGDEFSCVEARMPASDSWAPFLRDPRYGLSDLAPQQEATGFVGWGAMARITCLEQALAVRRPRPLRGALSFEIDDPLVPANTRPMTLRLENGRSAVEPGVRRGLLVRAPVDVFTQVWMGAVSPLHARRYGLLEADDDAAGLLEAACYGPPVSLGSLNEF